MLKEYQASFGNQKDDKAPIQYSVNQLPPVSYFTVKFGLNVSRVTYIGVKNLSRSPMITKTMAQAREWGYVSSEGWGSGLLFFIYLSFTTQITHGNTEFFLTALQLNWVKTTTTTTKQPTYPRCMALQMSLSGKLGDSAGDFWGVYCWSKDFLGFVGSPRDFLGFWFFSPFDHPCQLKSEYPLLFQKAHMSVHKTFSTLLINLLAIYN